MKSYPCKHFTGLMDHESCDVGVKYADVRVESTDGKGHSLPCLPKYNRLGAKCDKCEFPTAEEIAAEQAELKKHMEEVIKARDAIVEHLGGPWKKGMKGSAGAIPCPVCEKGDLRFARFGYNGHIHAACSTNGCVSWME